MNLEIVTVRRPEFTPALGVLIVLLALALMETQAGAAVREAWVQRYNSVQGRANDHVSSAVRDATGDIIVAASSDNNTTGYDILVVKFSGTNGAVMWQHRYDGPGHHADSPTGLELDPDGNVVVVGFSSNGTNSDIYTGKYSGSDGRLIWEKRYAGPANGDDAPTAISVDQGGNVIITGFLSNVGTTNTYNYPVSRGLTDIYTVKYASADGALLWERRYDGPAKDSDSPASMAIDLNGNVVVTASSVSLDLSADIYNVKYSGDDGSILWERRYEGTPITNAYPAALTLDLNGDILITGNTRRKLDGDRYEEPDFYAAKYSGQDGALLWEHSVNGPGNYWDQGTAVVADDAGNVIVTGMSTGTGNVSGFYTAKYSGSDGAKIWDRWSTNGGSLLALDGRGNIVMAGYEYIGGTTVGVFSADDGALVWERNFRQAQFEAPASLIIGEESTVGIVRSIGYVYDNYDFYLSMLGDDGRTLWQQKFDGPANASDRPSALVMDSNGDVIVTGNSITARYAAADGAELWRQPAGDLIAMDGVGNVFVAGFSWLGPEFDLSLIKYSPDGGVVWEQHRRGSSQLRVNAAAMVVDRDCYVIIAGEAQVLHGTVYGADYFTVKYAAADGALLWENVYNGLANNDDLANAVAVDREGNVFVTGVAGSSTNNGFGNYYTAKYAAADGRLLWERTYFGLGNGTDAASAIAVDGFGNVIVTGSSSNGANTDYATLKYSGVDGTTLWERRFNGPANRDDRPTGLAVDRDGNVVVTGDSSRSDQVTDFYTAKYEAASGAVLWEKRHADPAGEYSYDPKVAVDADGNPIISGYSGGGYHTAKYAKDDGALLWEKQLLILPILTRRAARVAGVAVGPDGMVAITGQYYVSFHDNAAEPDFDYVTVVYRENRPPVLACSSNIVEIATGAAGVVVEFTVTATDDSGVPPTLACLPPSGSVFPIGETTVNCTATDDDGLSNTCSFTVTVRGPRGIKQSVLAELITLRGKVTDRDDGRNLDDAIKHLTRSLAPEFWVDEMHLQRKHGKKVFQEEKDAAQKLCSLMQSRKSQLPDLLLQGFIDQLLQADRLLASVVIDEAIADGVSSKKIEQAQRFLARGDSDAGDKHCGNGIEEYRQAWKRVARPSVVPIRGHDGQVRLEIAAEPGEILVIQASSNLRDWVTLGRCVVGSDGMAKSDDPDARGQGARFYRVVDE